MRALAEADVNETGAQDGRSDEALIAAVSHGDTVAFEVPPAAPVANYWSGGCPGIGTRRIPLCQASGRARKFPITRMK